MKNKSFIWIAVVIVAALFLAGRFLVSSKRAEEQVFRVKAEYLIRATSFSKGPIDAPVTIVEFFDPECESCRAMHPIMNGILSDYGNKVRLVYRFTPLHDGSVYAASVLQEARVSGKFEEALATLFDKQPEWGSHESPRPDLIPSYLRGLGLTAAQLNETSVVEKHKAFIEQERSDSAALMVQQTPTFFVNARPIFSISEAVIREAIDSELKR